VEDPAAASVPSPIRATLDELAGRRGVRVALVTGRDPKSLRRMIHLEQAYRALEHGRRLVAPGQSARRAALSKDDKSRLDEFERWAALHAVPAGARLEHKPAARAVHVRALMAKRPAMARKLLALAERAAKDLGLHPRRGRAVLEAELERGDKGEALSSIVRATRARGVVYAGDDLTDLPAIRAARKLGGIGLFVRSKERPRPPAGASASLSGPEEMAALLARLVTALK